MLAVATTSCNPQETLVVIVLAPLHGLWNHARKDLNSVYLLSKWRGCPSGLKDDWSHFHLEPQNSVFPQLSTSLILSKILFDSKPSTADHFLVMRTAVHLLVQPPWTGKTLWDARRTCKVFIPLVCEWSPVGSEGRRHGEISSFSGGWCWQTWVCQLDEITGGR